MYSRSAENYIIIEESVELSKPQQIFTIPHSKLVLT